VILGIDIKPGEAVNLNPVIHAADTTGWMIETTDLNELEIVGVREGTPAVITIDALPGLELAGKVVRINRFGEVRDGDILYTVTIALDQPDPRLMWNMTAFVRLLTHAQLKPAMDQFMEKNMKKFVLSLVILFLLAGCGSPQTPSVNIPAVKDTQALKAKAKFDYPLQNAQLGFTGSGTVG
jgi:hypothetical protein